MMNQVKLNNSIRSWVVIVSASLFFLFAFIQLNMPNTISSQLMFSFSINTQQLGILSSMYFFGYFIMLFPAGLLLDRYSVRKLIIFAMLLCIVSGFLFSLTESVFYAGIYRFISGLSSAFAFLGCIRLALRWFPSQRKALVTGFISVMAMIGGIVVQTPMELFTTLFGWRVAMMIFSGAGILIMPIIFLFVQDYPQGISSTQIVHTDDEEKDKKKNIERLFLWENIHDVLFNKNNWLNGIYASLMNLPIFVLGALWGSFYLVKVNHLTQAKASTVISMIFFGTMVGAPFIGWISDYFKRRVLPMIIGSIISILIILDIIYFTNLSYMTLICLFFLLGLFSSAQILSYPTVTELNSPSITSSSVSIVSSLIIAGGLIFQPLFGRLVNLNGGYGVVNSAVNNIAVYSIGNFRLAMWIIPIGFIISLITAFFIRETYCQKQVN